MFFTMYGYYYKDEKDLYLKCQVTAEFIVKRRHLLTVCNIYMYVNTERDYISMSICVCIAFSYILHMHSCGNGCMLFETQLMC